MRPVSLPVLSPGRADRSIAGTGVPEKPWYHQGLKFRCTQCGNCCTGPSGYVWITDEEVGRLAEFLGRPREETFRRYCRTINGRISLKERKNLRGEYDCVFLKDTGPGKRGCSIYPARPLQCRTWPFWEGMLASPEMWRRAKHSFPKCPGLDVGKHYSFEQVEEIRKVTDWPLEPPGSK